MSQVVKSRAGGSGTQQLTFSAIAKPMGSACNLDCSYCFFLSKEVLYDESSQLMNGQTLRRYIESYLQCSADGDVVLGWQGGEPTMRGLDFFRQAVALAEELKRPTQTVTHAIQTNGTLLDDEWGRFLAENNFFVGISLDGPAHLHDTHRTNRAGRGTYEWVLRGYEILQHHQVNTSILCTVNSANVAYPLEVYRHFRDDLGAQSIQFIPIVERATQATLPIAERGWRDPTGNRVLATQQGSHVTSRTVDPFLWGQFLTQIFDEWLEHDAHRIAVQHFDSMLANRAGTPDLCVHAPTCGTLPAVTHNGDVYSCDHYVEPSTFLGNLMESGFDELLTQPLQKDFGRNKRSQLSDQCLDCPILWACNGGCPKDRFMPSTDGIQNQNYLCHGYFQFFSHAAPAIEQAYRRLTRGLVPYKEPEVPSATHGD